MNMKRDFFFFHLLTAVALLAMPVLARADHNPDFDDDATPILRMQPGLLQYVKQNFEVKDTGIAKFPGDEDRRPMPPYIFQAKPRGAPGPYNLRLLIQPGPAGHILNVADITKVHAQKPVAQQQPPMNQPQPASNAPQQLQPEPAQQTPAPAAQPPSEPTADTPSGPITSNPGQAQPSLEPPPDPQPTH
jgi:hypothetical protein